MSKLSVNHKRLLTDLQDSRWHHAGHMKVTTNALIDAGLLELRGRKIAVTGRLVRAGDVRITDAGKAALVEAA